MRKLLATAAALTSAGGPVAQDVDLDLDGDGLLSQEEFVVDERLGGSFAILDADNDAFIDETDFGEIGMDDECAAFDADESNSLDEEAYGASRTTTGSEPAAARGGRR